MLNKTTAAFLAIFLGIFGTHQFYVGRQWQGVLQFGFFLFTLFMSMMGAAEELLVLAWIFTAVTPFLTGILWAVMPEQKWRQRYDADNAVSTIPAPGTNAAYSSSSDLKAEGIRYYRSADYDLAVEAFTEAVAADGTDPGSHFNLACSYAQLGRYPETLRHLELSVTFGLPKPQRIEKHPALGAIRKLPAFAKFRANNYRRQSYVSAAPSAEVDAGSSDRPATEAAPPREEVFEDFATPPPRREAPTPERDVNGDLLEQISRLRELHDAGVLTPREYRLQKERLLK